MSYQLQLAAQVYFGINYVIADYEPSWFDANNGGSTYDGLDKLKIKVTKKDDGQRKVRMTSEIRITGSSRDFIMNNLLPTPGAAPIFDYIWCRIIDDCCDEEIFRGQIYARDIEWNTCDCHIAVKASEYSKATDMFNIISKEIMTYKDGSGDDIFGAFHTYRKRSTTVSLRWHKAPDLKSWIRDNLSRFNISFQSTIFDNILNNWTGDNYNIDSGRLNGINPYKYTSYLDAAIEQGQLGGPILPDDAIDGYEEYNKVIISIKELLDKLKDIYNADYQLIIIGGIKTLIFERKDYFSFNANIWQDLTNSGCVKFEIAEKNNYAAWVAEMRKNLHNDNDDEGGDRVYRGSESWLIRANPTQRGLKRLNPLFNYPEYQYTTTDGTILALDKTGLTSAPILIARTGDYIDKNGIEINSGHYFNMILSGAVAGLITQTIIRETNGCYWLQPDYRYSLYQNFHFIDNPTNPYNARGFAAKSINYGRKFKAEKIFNCNDYLDFNENSAVLLSVDGVNAIGQIEEVEFDFGKNIMKIEGSV